MGKTVITRNLGEILAADGMHVLMIDVDPQSSLTGACGFASPEHSLADVLVPGGLQLGEIVLDMGGGLHLAPASIDLAGVDLALISRLGREQVLTRALAGVSGFDLCLLDCPPSLGILTIAALTASHAVLVPTQAETVAIRGLMMFLRTFDQVRNELNPDLALLGVVVTFYDKRLVHHQLALEAMLQAELPVLLVKIGRSVRVAESAGLGQALTTYEPENPRAEEFRQLAEVIKKWLRSSSAQG